MKPDPLDRLLDELAAEPLPSAPPNLEAKVLRAIRLEAAESSRAAWPSWLSLPRFGAATGAAALISGLVIGSFSAGAVDADGAGFGAREVLALDVFGAHAPGLPHHLLSHP